MTRVATSMDDDDGGDDDGGTARAEQRRRRRPALALAVAAIVAPLLAAMTVPAHAHTDLVGSTPQDGDTVSMSTERVVLVFADELASAGQVVVRDVGNADVVVGAPRVTGESVVAALELRRPGRHVVTFRVVAEDGHVVVGELAFRVSPPEGGGQERTGGRPSDRVEASGSTTPGESPDLSVPGSSLPLRSAPPEQSAAGPAPAWWLAALSALGAVGLLARRLVRGRGPRV